MKKGESKKGFTIIEVVLVLAIAGLIFTMVFVALPALQRSQRDNARRDDMLSFISNVKKYQTNNRGALPKKDDSLAVVEVVVGSSGWTGAKTTDTNWFGFYKGYLGENFRDPDGENYKLRVTGCASGVDEACSNQVIDKFYEHNFQENNYAMIVVLQSKCGTKSDGTVTAVGSSNPRNVSVLYRLESAGIYCANT